MQTVICFALHVPGRVPRQHVDLALLQLGKALTCIERNKLDLGRVVEDRRRDRTAEIDVEAGPVFLLVGERETGQTRIDTAKHGPCSAFAQGSWLISFIGDRRRGDGDRDDAPKHKTG